jgi:predicted TIM-barrel fold metal-dependent hydrolase
MVIDFHAHAFPDALAPRAIEKLNSGIPEHGWAVLDGTVDGLLRSMDDAGIDCSVICSIATTPKQVEPVLRWSLEIASDRIIPFGSVHPEGREPASEVRRIRDAGLKGIKLHAMYQQFIVDEPRMWPVYEAACEAGLILVLHAGRDVAFDNDRNSAAPCRTRRVQDAFPDLKIVAAHMGGWKMWDEVADSLAGSSVYLETSYSFGIGADIAMRKLITKHPLERILFGTDSPWVSQKDTVRHVRAAFPRAADQDRVFHRNAATLLGLD